MVQEDDKNIIDLSKKLQKSVSGQKPPGPYISPTAPKIVRWVIKYSGGLVKNEKQASYLLLGFAVLMIIISIFLIFSKGVGPQTLEPAGPAIEEAGSPKDITPY